MQKQQFGPSAGVAVPGMLDEEVEAAYKQFGRALGETPRETSKVVRAKYNIPAAPPQQLARRPVGPAGPSERCRCSFCTLLFCSSSSLMEKIQVVVALPNCVKLQEMILTGSFGPSLAC